MLMNETVPDSLRGAEPLVADLPTLETPVGVVRFRYLAFDDPFEVAKIVKDAVALGLQEAHLRFAELLWAPSEAVASESEEGRLTGWRAVATALCGVPQVSARLKQFFGSGVLEWVETQDPVTVANLDDRTQRWGGRLPDLLLALSQHPDMTAFFSSGGRALAASPLGERFRAVAGLTTPDGSPTAGS